MQMLVWQAKSALFKHLTTRIMISMFNKLKKSFTGPTNLLSIDHYVDSHEKLALVQARILSELYQTKYSINALSEIEFSVFSQWGEDGIIEWIVNKTKNIPKSFVEFGVENYNESNTRFLLQNRNWKGLVIDSSEKNILDVKARPIYWKHSLTAVSSFITRENINDLLLNNGFSGEIGILSIDIDGNDYWIWEAIDVVNPQILIIEYNSCLGDLMPLTIPYDKDFMRTKKHYSNLYYGASIAAIKHLAAIKGYELIGSNSAGSNAFFLRTDIALDLRMSISDTNALPSMFRESRGKDKSLTCITGMNRSAIIADLPLHNVADNTISPLSSYSCIYSDSWTKLLSF